MAYQSTTDSSRKFGSAFRGKRFDAYHGGDQPSKDNENSHAEPQKARSLDVEPKDSSVPKGEHSEHTSVETPSSIVAAHGPAHTVHIAHKEDGTHTTSSEHNDGYTHETMHGSVKEAHDSAEQLSLERGGEDQATDVKKRTHPDQQGAESSERGYESADLV
jgi:hypothetical protein